jgi:hypothetical protein
MKPIKTKLKDNAEPLIELFYQEFPDRDPQEIERMIKTIIKYAEQRINDITTFKKELKKQGENIDLEPLHDGTIMEYMCLIRDLKKQIKK